MTQAKDIMRPAGAVVPVEELVGDALAKLRESGGGPLVALDDDEVAGVVDPYLFGQLEHGKPEFSDEMIGNLISLTFRTCRPDDDVRMLENTFERSGAAFIVVAEPGGKVHGLVSPADLPGMVRG